ncbi:TetR/AcrR family transcriptional regulator [Sphingobium sp.]|uniref:TetR/AcrR family transcriptional regulator n=1 Tax=Sphingobium sp. TaxID=1912891 RepID=UPI0035C6AFC9
MMQSAAVPVENDDLLSSILSAATEEFVAQGYRDASIDRIVAAAHVSKTTFYSHFRNKREVLGAALDRVEERLNDRFPSPRESSDIEDTLIRYAQWIRRVASSPEYIALYRVSVELAREEPEFAQSIHERVRDRRGVFWRYLETLRHSGIRIAYDSAALQAQFGFLSIGGLTTIIQGADLGAMDERRWTKSVATLFMNGYRREQADADAPAILPPARRPVPSPESSEELYARLRSSGMRLSRDQFDALLDISAERFLEKGYRDTALPDISARTGVSRMTLRRQFNGKAELFVAAIRHYAYNLYSRTEPLPTADSIDAALPLIAAHLRRRFRRPDNSRLLRLMVSQSVAFPQLAAAVYAGSREDDLTKLRAQFAEWMARGELGTAYAEMAAHHFHTLAINGNAALFRGEAAQTDASPEQVSVLFLDGCMPGFRSEP